MKYKILIIDSETAESKLIPSDDPFRISTVSIFSKGSMSLQKYREFLFNHGYPPKEIPYIPGVESYKRYIIPCLILDDNSKVTIDNVFNEGSVYSELY